MCDASDLTATMSLHGRKVAFLGKLGAVTRREAQQLVRQHGGTVVDPSDANVQTIVIGAEHFPLDEEYPTDLTACGLADDEPLEIITETQLWQRLGLVENEQNVRRLYTPAMLADLLDVPIGIIRRWHRRGLIVPVREVNRLPYFDFQEVATARRLAQLLAAGASPAVIETKLEELARYLPDVDRPMSQLSVIVEGRQLLLRHGEGLIEPSGQRRLDFSGGDDVRAGEDQDEPGDASACSGGSGDARVLPFGVLSRNQGEEFGPPATPDELLSRAADLEDEGQLEAAIELYRASMMMNGSSAEVCFSLAELLYRMNDVSGARERYYMAIELDEDYVEARANLGCVLAEQGQLELAVAAFHGALQRYRDYPDVHYHLARILDELGRRREAEHHWREFLALAHDSPWADEARVRLGDW